MSGGTVSLENVRQSLTERQSLVFDKIAERRSYKEIAAEMDISVARVGQYTQVLKHRFQVQTLGDLAYIHSLLEVRNRPLESDPSPRFKLPRTAENPDPFPQDDRTEFVFSDIAKSSDDWKGSWYVERNNRVVPGALDGERGTIFRLGYMLAVAIGLPAAVIIVIAAMLALSEMFVSA